MRGFSVTAALVFLFAFALSANVIVAIVVSVASLVAMLLTEELIRP